MISELQLYQNAENPSQQWIYTTDPAGQPAQYLLNNEQFNKLSQLGFTPQPVFNDPLQYSKGNLPSLNFLQKEIQDTANQYRAYLGPQGGSFGERLNNLVSKFQNVDFSKLSNVQIGGITQPLEATSKTAAGKALMTQDQFKTQTSAFKAAKLSIPDIPFRSGLSEPQQISIIDLVSSKPITQWNETDKRNWNYATNNAPLPKQEEIIRATTPGVTTIKGIGGGQVDLTQSPTDVAFKNTDAYKGLSAEDQSFIDMAFNLVNIGGEDEARRVADAIKAAKQIADPYYKSQLTLALGEIGSTIAGLNQDYETKAEIIRRTQSELAEDVVTQKDFLTLEQQSDLARVTRQYDDDILKIRDIAAERGITISTGYRSREELERGRTTELQDVIESSGRQFNFRIADLERRVARGDVEAAKQLESLTGRRTLALQDIGRTAEAKLGTANVPIGTGHPPVGGVTGQLEEEKRQNILRDVFAISDLGSAFL